MSNKAAGRRGDMGSSHGAWHPSPAITGSPDVFINGKPALRVGDALAPHVKPKRPPHGRAMAQGFSGVLINGKPACAVGHKINCGGTLSAGSPNVFFGDKPQPLTPEVVTIPPIVFPNQRGHTPSGIPSDSVVVPPKTASEPVFYTAPVQQQHSSAHYWQTQRDAAEDFPSHLAAQLMALHVEGGYSIAEGLQTIFAVVTDRDQSQGIIDSLADEIVAKMTNPVDIYNSIKAAAQTLSTLPLSAQGDALYKASLSLLAGDDNATALNRLGHMLKGAGRLNSINQKRVQPQNLEGAYARLVQRRAAIAENGYAPKYTHDELNYLAHVGEVGDERFQVRFMESRYLNHRETPDKPLSGALGMTMTGASGKGAKYWSTSFDQLEDADTDPKLLAEKLGLDYNPKADYTLVIVDTEKAMPLTGVKSVPATFDQVAGFVNTELPDDFPKDFTDQVMTPAFQAEYARHYHVAVEQQFLKDQWSKDTESFDKYLKSVGIKKDDRNRMKQRMIMHEKVGNNQDYLGNGLTKDNIPNSDNEFGVVETFNFERKEVSLKKLNDAGAIKVIKGLKRL
ncbi:MAG: PAAR domain-containing protein [Cellvibrionaceae bacterium]|nr:PAAR domain-containing protein [Cellvibrionaceae bacterium]